MDRSWNDFELRKPPFITLPTTNTKFVVNLHGVIENYFRKQIKHEEEFNETAALLGRLMARRKNSFKKMKGFKALCKLNAAMCRLLRVDFKRDIDSFRCILPDVEYDEDTVVHLPTRDNLDYILVRLLAVCGLFERIAECCLEAAEYFTMQLRVHYFFEINTLLVAVVAKVNSLTIKLGNSAVNLYNDIQEYRNKLPLNEKSKFVLSAQELPNRLEKLLKPFVMNEKPENSEKSSKLSEEPLMANLLQQEEAFLTTPIVKAKCLKKKDIGTKVERLESKKVLDIDRLNTVDDIKTFIFKETKARAKNITFCVTKQVLSHEWMGATKHFERKIQNREVKKAINIFKKFLSSKI